MIHTVITLATIPILIFIGNPAGALLVGIIISLTLNKTVVRNASIYSKYLLQTAIVLLGVKLNFTELWEISAKYTLPVAGYVILTLTIGISIGILLKLDRISSLLMAAGTAICGGTTISSLSPIVKASVEQLSSALAIVFLLNALALFTFPFIGEQLSLSQEQFGVWVALAIHDTSSVVATAQIYGNEAAEVATTVKLGRTLWLIPVVIGVSLWFRKPEAKAQLPGFILLFVAVSLLNSIISLPSPITIAASWLSKSLLVLALFFIGVQISRETLTNLKGKVLLHALILWFIAIPITLLAVIKWVP